MRESSIGLHVQVPAALHRAVRVRAAERGETLATLVRRALEREVEEEGTDARKNKEGE